MKKYLAIAAAAAAVIATEASADFTVGAGVSMVNFGGKTTNNGSTMKTIHSESVAGDLQVAYIHNMGKFHAGVLAFIQTGGGKGVYTDATVKFERKYAYGAALRGGMEIAPKTSAFIALGMKHGRFEYTNAATKKTDNKWGFLASIGLETALSDKMALNLAYERVQYGDVKSKNSSGVYKTKMIENNVRLGVAYKF